MGLLDTFSGLGNLDDTQTQGLLSAGATMLQNSGPSRTPVGFGQILGSGIGAYQDSTIAAKKRALEEQHAKNLSDYQGLQMQEMQGNLQDSAAKRAHEEAVRQFYIKNAAPVDPAAQGIPAPAPAPMASAMPGTDGNPRIGGPDWLQSYQQAPQAAAPAQPAPVQAAQQGGAPSPYAQRMAMAQRLRDAGLHTEADAQEAAALKFKPEFSTEPRAGLGADNKTIMYVQDKDGNTKILNGVQPRDEMKLFDNGQSSTAYNPYQLAPGQSFKKYMTPGETATNNRAIAQLNFQKEQAAAKNDGPADTPFMREADAMYKKGTPEYDEVMRQRINKEAGINAGGGGGRSVVYNGRIIASGNEVAQALRNISDLPVQSNAGFMGMGKPESTGLFSAGMAGLKNELNPDQIKTYNTMWTGVSRNLGTLETSGLATTGDLIKSIDKLQFVPGDNGYNALRKLAEVRQITEAALEPKLHDPAVPGQQREYIKGVIDAVHAAVPYTHSDLTKYDRALQKNPALTLQEFASQTVNKGPAPAAPSAFSVQAPNGKTYSFPDAKSLANFKLKAGI